jgi:hypothetical protein
MHNRWYDNSTSIIDEVEEFYRSQKKSSSRSPQKIVQASQFLINCIALYEVHGKLAGDMATKIVQEFPEIVKLVKNEESFQSTIDSLSVEKESCLVYSYYRNQSFVTGHSMETLGKYHLKASKCVAPPLKSILNCIHKDGSLYSILPSVLKYLKCIYEGDFRELERWKSEYDKDRNKSRGNRNN